jgi:hypothetical protein
MRAGMKSAPSKIGEPPDRWPLTTLAKKHANINCEAELKKADDQKCSCDACLILVVHTVIGWVYQADDDAHADRRACSLLTAVATARYNAVLPFVTPTHHRKHYIGLAERLEKRPS